MFYPSPTVRAGNADRHGANEATEQETKNSSEAGSALGKTGSNGKRLTDEEAAAVAKLQETDRKVRQHEQAHLAASGGLATSSASFSYQRGPDGVNYAVGGEVGIDTSPGRTPDDTINRARTIRSAALAPADPSSQDYAIAAKATQMEMQARMEQSKESSPSLSPSDSADPNQKNRDKVASYYASVEQNSDDQVAARLDVYA